MASFLYYESFILLFYTMSPLYYIGQKMHIYIGQKMQKMSGTLYISFENVDIFNDLYKFEKEFKKNIR